MTLIVDTKDVAQGQLDSSINAAAVSIQVQSGEGAHFPQPYKGTASSTGDSETLNDTGDLGDLAVGDILWNQTDDSWCRVISVASAPNSVTTTRLRGGTDNTWQSGDVWVKDAFVITVDDGDANGENITKREKILIVDRSADILTVDSSVGRGYDGSTAQSFDADDYIRLNVLSLAHENLKVALGDLAETINTNEDTLETAIKKSALIITDSSELTIASGEITLTGPIHTVDTEGDASSDDLDTINQATSGTEIIILKAANSARATVLKHGTGNISMVDSADFTLDNTQKSIALIRQGATWYELFRSTGASAQDVEVRKNSIANSTAVGSSSTAENNLDDNYAIPENDWAAGCSYLLRVSGEYRLDSGNAKLYVKLGSTKLGTIQINTTTTGEEGWTAEFEIVCRSTGVSGSVIVDGNWNGAVHFNSAGEAEAIMNTSLIGAPTAVTIDTTAAQTLQLSAQFSASNAAHKFQTNKFKVVKYNAPS